MAAERRDRVGFGEWIARPQSLIAIAALLLSVCGLFLAIYEASMTRRAQRASVWPRVEVNASLDARQIEVWVVNVGVGPARVRSAALTHHGEALGGWEDLSRVAGLGPGRLSYYYSVVVGRVLPRDSEPETIFRVASESFEQAPELVAFMRDEFLAGRLDVSICYCSVYENCWESSLQDLFSRSREGRETEERMVESCRNGPRSGI